MQSSAPERLALAIRPSSSPSPCPTSAAKQTTRAPYCSRSHGTMADVSSPPEYARTTSGPGWPWCCLCIDNTTRSEEHTSELQSQSNLVCRLLLEKKKKKELDDHAIHNRAHSYST